MIGALFGVFAALLIGVGDLFGRSVSNRSSPITSATAMQCVAAITLIISLLFWNRPPDGDDLLLGALSGLGAATGLCCYYMGLKTTSSAVVAPIAAVVATMVPVFWALATDVEVSYLSGFGVGIALVGLVLVTADGRLGPNVRAGAIWGLASGLGYGFGFGVLLNVTMVGGTWVLVSQRLLAFAIMIPVATAVGARMIPPRGTRLMAIAAGVSGGATSVAFLVGLQFDPLPTVVAMSLFPVFSILVGWLVFKDQVSIRQVWGIALAVIGTGVVVGG